MGVNFFQEIRECLSRKVNLIVVGVDAFLKSKLLVLYSLALSELLNVLFHSQSLKYKKGF